MTTGADTSSELESNPLFLALAQAADSAGLGVSVTLIDEPMQTVFVNEGAARLFGYTPDEMKRMRALDLVAPEELPRLMPMLANRLRGDTTPLVYQTVIVRKDGSRVPIEVSTSRVTLDGRLANVTYTFDISRRKHDEAAIARSEALIRSLVVSAPDGIVILRGPFLVFANPTAVRLLGYDRSEDVLGRSIVDLLHPDDAKAAQERIQTMLRTGAKYAAAAQYRPSAERVSKTVVEISSVAIEYEGGPAVLAFARDVTERKALEARLIRADRLSALGTLAAGVAHEINNPLAYVLLNLQYLERKLPLLPEQPQLVDAFLKRMRDAISGAQRVGNIVRDLRTFARPDEDSYGPVELASVIESAVRMAHHEMRHRAQVVLSIPPLPMIDGNSGRMEQLFLNLLVNAAHAMDANQLERNQVSITATTRDHRIVIEVADNGRGMEAAVLDRVFDPFFTTKPVGQGSGLGLSICQSIVTSLGGSISIQSQPGRGTRVTVVLLAHRPASTPPAEYKDIVSVPPQPRRGRILIVDDEPIVAETLAQLLSDQHDVDVATSAPRALERIAEAHHYDVILCDLVMPGMTGMQLHAALSQHQPTLAARMLFMTGGAFLPEAEAFLRDGNRQAIQKPFDLEALTKLIDRALNDRG